MDILQTIFLQCNGASEYSKNIFIAIIFTFTVVNILSALLNLVCIHILCICFTLCPPTCVWQVAAVRGAQCCSQEGVKGELTWTERSSAGVNELSKNFHYDIIH